MEPIHFSFSDGKFELLGFPDAVKVVGLRNEGVARRLADLSLHRADLLFAEEALSTLNATLGMPRFVQEALWRAAIIHFQKCFGDGARFQLNAKQIYRNENLALLAYDYFKKLRNKHLIHDENSYAQAVPGAILARPGMPYKVEKIVCVSAIGLTLGDENFGNLASLVGKALEWVNAEHDLLCEKIATDLELKSYAELLAMPHIQIKTPDLAEIGKRRS